MLESWSEAFIDLDSNLVSNEHFSKMLCPTGLALGQVTWAKIALKLLHIQRHSQKIRNPQALQNFPMMLLFRLRRPMHAPWFILSACLWKHTC